MNKTKLHPQTAAVARIVLLTMVVPLSHAFPWQNACDCSSDGLSNGVEIEKPRCALRSESPVEPTCFVQNSTNCEKAVNSTEYPGAAFAPCSVSEALFTAAELDDVDSIVRFRELGASLDIKRRFPYPFVRFGYRRFSVVEYAAIWGSFHVVEDMLLNDDFNCDDSISLYYRLCRLSNELRCRKKDEKRKAIEDFIDLIVTQTCGLNDVELFMETRSDGRSLEKEVFVERVYGGVDARCDSYTYFASLRTSLDNGYRHVCGGVLISERAVLTAAHCVDGTGGLSIQLVTVSARGSDDDGNDCHTNPSEARRVAGIEMHPKWSVGEKARSLGNGYDLAVIKLNKPSEKTPIKVHEKTNITADFLNFVGLGRQSVDSRFASNLQVSRVSVLSKADCEKAYDTTFQRNILCTDYDSEFCAGDEGGPLIDTTSKPEELVAIAHLKHPSDVCGNSDFPGLYADVIESRSWITETVTKFSEDS